MANTSFAESLERGKVGESKIARWMRSRGWSIMPVYDIEEGSNKVPRIFALGKELVAPDILAFNNDFPQQPVRWIEAKTKTRFIYFGLAQEWRTGIDLRHYLDYCEIDDKSPFPVWLMFLHEDPNTPQEHISMYGAPAKTPTGLFGQTLKHLRTVEKQRVKGYGNGGMVLWSYDALKRLADISELQG